MKSIKIDYEDYYVNKNKKKAMKNSLKKRKFHECDNADDDELPRQIRTQVFDLPVQRVGHGCHKPVILFYPPLDREIEFNVSVNIPSLCQEIVYIPNPTNVLKEEKQNKLSQTCDTYLWKGVCKSDIENHSLIKLENSSDYDVPYIFYEYNPDIKTKENLQKMIENDFLVIKKEEILDFLRKALKMIGFTPREIFDLATFWCKSFTGDYIHLKFLFDFEYGNVSSIDITPKPDNFIRMILAFRNISKQELNDNYETVSTDIENNLTLLSDYMNDNNVLVKSRDQKSFTVVEWGGIEL